MGTTTLQETSEASSLTPEGRQSHLRYVVRSGDTLSGIAHQTLGQSSRFHEIFAANRDVLSSPDDLKPGLELVIPSHLPHGGDTTTIEDRMTLSQQPEKPVLPTEMFRDAMISGG